jgi:hypothetical protein
MSFKAKYDGWCSECGEPIREGDELEWGDEGRVVHAECLPDAQSVKNARLGLDRPACPKCFQIPAANGQCGCDPE